jgi:hypothetical protein
LRHNRSFKSRFSQMHRGNAVWCIDALIYFNRNAPDALSWEILFKIGRTAPCQSRIRSILGRLIYLRTSAPGGGQASRRDIIASGIASGYFVTPRLLNRHLPVRSSADAWVHVCNRH